MQVERLLPGIGIGVRVIVQKRYLCLEEGTVLIELDYLESAKSAGDDVELAMVISLHHRHHFCRAPDLCKAIFDGAHDPKWRIVPEALADHLLVAWLEDMKR